MRVSVIGCGYLGAVHATVMADLGHDVVGLDVDAARVEKLRRGETPFYEPGLAELLHEALASGRLRFTTDPAEVAASDVHFIAVGTPQTDGGTAADLGHLEHAIDDIIPHLRPGVIVVGKSTVPVGTAQRMKHRIAAAGVRADLIWNPEFLREGYAIADTRSPDRIVYGLDHDESVSRRAVTILDEVYAAALSAGVPRFLTDYATSELVKTAANAFLATKISFINAMSEIAHLTGADITALADAIGCDERIGRRFLNAGVGFGGGCLPKDLRALTARAEELGAGESVAFLKEVDQINLRQRQRVTQLATDMLGGSVYQKRIAVLGVTFKPHSDDVRDSPALDVAVQLKGLGAEVIAADPKGIENAKERHPQLSYTENAEVALASADLVILVTEWDEYRSLDPEATKALVRAPRIIDARNALPRDDWRRAGWTYQAMGRR